MHELSIVMGIIEIAQQEAEKAEASIIDEIEIDIGCLSTVQMDAFDFAWDQAVKQTILENTVKKFNRIKGEAQCIDCAACFEIDNLYDPCPVCNKHLINIITGKDLRVKSLVVSSRTF